MGNDWRNELVTEQQIEKLRFFGCTWDEGITVGQASDALEACARQFPDVESAYLKTLPATERQKEKLRYFSCTWIGAINVEQASDALAECAKQFPDKEAAWQFQKKKWSKMPGTLLEKAFEKLNEAVSQKPPIQKVFPKKELSAHLQSKSQPASNEVAFQEVTIQKAEKSATPPAAKSSKANGENLSPPIVKRNDFWHPPDGNLTPSIYLHYPPEPQITDAKYRAWDDAKGREYGLAKDRMRWAETVRQIETENQRRYNVSFEEGVEKARQFLNQFRPTIQPVPGDSPPATIPATADQVTELRVFGKEPPQGLTYQEAKIWIEQLKIFFAPKTGQCPPEPHTAESYDWRNAPATEKQKEKLRSFGSQFDEGIKQKPDSTGKSEVGLYQGKKEWDEWIALQERLSFPSDKTTPDKVTIQEAAKPINDKEPELPIYLEYPPEPRPDWFSGSSFDRAQAIWEVEFQQTETENRRRYDRYLAEIKQWNSQQNPNAIKRPETFPEIPKRQNESQSITVASAPAIIPATTEQVVGIRAFGKEPPQGLTYQEANIWIEQCRILCPPKPQNVEFKEVTIQEAIISQNPSPQDYTIPAQEVQTYAQRQPVIRRPATYENTTPIERFEEWLDNLLKRNQTIMGGHWLPVGPMHYVLRSDAISIGLCRQIADLIESKGFCVEPDARYGSGTYERDQTFALFKPLGSDAIKPSTGYLGAANLLRLCVLIATADGRIDLVELDAFRSAVENQAGLSQTDQKRLIVLEQLLAQELCSAAKAVPRIAKSVSAENRLIIGKLLVDVAAVNQIITPGERRALEKIFKAFEIPPDMLQTIISENQRLWKWPRPESGQDDVSKNDRWLWNHWRTGHPGVVIDDDTLTKKTWNFNDWKSLNARWRALHERLIEPQEHSGASQEVSFQKARTVLSGKQISKTFSGKRGFCKCCENENAIMSRSPSGEVRSYCLDCEGEIKNRVFDQRLNRWIKDGQSPKQIQTAIATPAVKTFSLDMDKVYAITNETKEVVGILSVLMADEPEASIALPQLATVPAVEIPQSSSTDTMRFNGLKVAFQPVLERLLSRDSWPLADFNALARKFQFLPLDIRDTLNEWSDEALGDFILDGEDPVIVHRELMAKEKI